METIYIADDESAIREGIKYIIDWETLGFTVCGEAGNGEDALRDILSLNPTLVLIDIRMPKLYGLEVIEQARAQGFLGTFVILSGYSDFKYAQAAMKFGVKYYLTKPLDEDELTRVVEEISDTLKEERAVLSRNEFLRIKSKKEILQDIIRGEADLTRINLAELHLDADVYQVVAYESFDIGRRDIPYQFADLFQVAGNGTNSFEHFEYAHKNILLLKGTFAMEKFKRFLTHYEQLPQKGSPLDTLFLAYGAPVHSLTELPGSYEQAAQLLTRRFFCEQGQHVLSFADLPSVQQNLQKFDKSRLSTYCTTITDCLQTFNRRKVAEVLYELEEYLYHVDANITEVKLFLTDLYLRIKETITHRYSSVTIPFDSNSDSIAFISSQNYLYEIILYFSTQFEQVMNATGNSSRDSVLDDILYYIEHNYHTNLKLETIAALFGYNSSYLGKIFNKTVGESFNSYVDQVRIRHAIELLTENKYKVYEIAEQVGYKNVDYFHKKFKKYVGESPAEYRKKTDSQ
ncbi:MAG: helix-turn-helix domain-containing protein [Lachnospiraceae bacterium]